MLSAHDITSLVERLNTAARTGTAMRAPTALHPGLTLADAYAVQESWTERHCAAGRRRIGYKLGLTTPAAQKGLGIDRPIYGVLFEDMRIADGGTLALKGLIAPRAEPELAFVMKTALAGECSAQEALAAIDYAAPAMEIIDNRVLARDPDTGHDRRALDIIADGGGTCAFVVGTARFDPRALDLAKIETRFTAGSTGGTGLFSNVFGSPENALIHLARELAARGGSLQPGDTVLTGSPLKPAALASGDTVTADFGSLGAISLSIA
ncbi:MAG TPA: fumarylacetoacetate hydrolase family protein [Sphingobium sp.]|nr:fumarylacetoacetate hydrolase family protein [Sphingobium sp.]